jgi:hypothetical protein
LGGAQQHKHQTQRKADGKKTAVLLPALLQFTQPNHEKHGEILA